MSVPQFAAVPEGMMYTVVDSEVLNVRVVKENRNSGIQAIWLKN